MGKKTKSTHAVVTAPAAPMPTASTKSKSAKAEKHAAPQSSVRHRHKHRKDKLFMVSPDRAKRLALRAGEQNISLQHGVPQFLTVYIHHLGQTLGTTARLIADCRKKGSTVRASDMQEAIRTQFHVRVYNTATMLSDEKRARRVRARRLAREQEQKEKKKAEAADAATSEAANA